MAPEDPFVEGDKAKLESTADPFCLLFCSLKAALIDLFIKKLIELDQLPFIDDNSSPPCGTLEYVSLL